MITKLLWGDFIKAFFEIELKWDDTRQLMRLFDRIAQALPEDHSQYREVFRPGPSQSWVAEITGFDARYEYQRNFLRFKKDYSRANSKGSRGVYAVYTLESGKLYDIKDGKYRYFATVTDTGDIEPIKETEVWRCLKNLSG